MTANTAGLRKAASLPGIDRLGGAVLPRVVTVHTRAGGTYVVARENFGFDALAVHHRRLTTWQLGPGAAAWQATQTMNVPVQFGSSG